MRLKSMPQYRLGPRSFSRKGRDERTEEGEPPCRHEHNRLSETVKHLNKTNTINMVVLV
jgi:hypothetical protein